MLGVIYISKIVPVIISNVFVSPADVNILKLLPVRKGVRSWKKSKQREKRYLEKNLMIKARYKLWFIAF